MLNLTPTEKLAWRGFLHAHDTLWKGLDAELGRDDLNLPAYELLTALQEAGLSGMRMTELARTLRFSGGGLTRLADKLRQQGLIGRRRCPDDGRGWEVYLTSVGEEKLRRIHARHLREVRRRFLDKLSPQETELLAGLWPRFQEDPV
ncbi:MULTISPECIES: MarR family winged helix-turn-helix transcriptional regulator [Deinococcus]|uniref:MarR family winged helix-turn-helix transcriptional regulator n=1 Tax=Deinococcus rufus TaxID=2136097 RepID=A0ABV7Z4E6_9DEIO|nr:MarR family transcriptional regulator [Deinococcus sp. AB2017081]WQE96099.1 MarR family transcriptional regulator [Deinococcus sp. AB2017081]